MQLSQLATNTDDWEKRAEKVLSHFNYNSADQIDMFDICWRYGISVKPLEEPFISKDLDFNSIKHLKSFSVPKSTGRKGTIYLQPSLDAVEKKIILAEEFCHIYSHYSSQLTANKYMIAKQENQAKRMAAYLLLPAKFLKDVYATAIYEPVMITDIADHFLVTEDFVHFRLELTFHHRVDGFVQLKERLCSFEWI
ncbi:ImmA/IrrE family metallo-endopeptidase [Peribacillus loiseleuriae]|uniref:IrrE N-terminal-like domain-containing protein n=1 Tax=Peribacillus loiseleuriae TaxID=1679170 RepID=A0A0K9GRE1_9BACI|nr:ImmA/IrrE family metallo-endopeptidase [Peribacillus loiseleuriae]KMY49198.1 hypothetical protein AC625_06410 [Peribacillus loiseleuriae]